LQGSVLKADPSVMLHGGPEQKLVLAVQYKPWSLVQRLLPHRQAAKFALVPFVCVQTLPERQMKNFAFDPQSLFEVSVGLK